MGPNENEQHQNTAPAEQPDIETPAAGTSVDPLEYPPEIKTSWLHPTSLIFELLSHSRELIIPIGIAIFSAAQGSRSGLFFGIAFFVPAVIYSVFRYFTLRYKIDQGELVVKQGLIFRNVRTVPVGRIQNIDLVQNPLHRIFRVAEVRIETASGTEPEATLRVLSMQKLAELRRLVFETSAGNTQQANLSPSDSPSKMDGEIAAESSKFASSYASSVEKGERSETTLLQIPTIWLLKAGLASNRGLLVIGLAIGTWFQFDLEEKIDLDQVQQFLPVPDGTLVNTLAIAGLIVAGLLLLRLFGVFWFLLRFHGYKMTLHGEDLRITCGLFTKVSATIPRKRIQFISIHRALIMRWFGLASIRIETAGGGGLADNASTTISRRWFVPVIDEDRVGEFVALLRPGLTWHEQTLDWKPLAEGAERRLIRIALVQGAIFSGIGFALAWNVANFASWWGLLLGPLLLPLLILWAKKKARAMRYVRDKEFLVYRSGVLDRKTSLTFFDKVQTVLTRQSPFDRRWKMATLTVDTAASGPAEHRIRVRYLDEKFAELEHREINRVASRYLPDFG